MHYGRALFSNRVLIQLIDALRMPTYLWLKYGCCMDLLSNPGFVTQPGKGDEVFAAMAGYLKSHTTISTIAITDYIGKASLYRGATVLPFMPHGLVDVTHMTCIQDYTRQHKHFQKKANKFRNHGGTIEVVQGTLDDASISAVERCFISTAEMSSTYLPYEDIYLKSALASCRMKADNIFHFLARKEGALVGYQSAIQTGEKLNALHGAFDRELEKTFYAYDNIIVTMADFAIRNGLECVDFGSILNFTKQRMMNKALSMSYYILCNTPWTTQFMGSILKHTKMQSEGQMQFVTSESQ
jgi:hypothetical protein